MCVTYIHLSYLLPLLCRQGHRKIRQCLSGGITSPWICMRVCVCSSEGRAERVRKRGGGSLAGDISRHQKAAVDGTNTNPGYRKNPIYCCCKSVESHPPYWSLLAIRKSGWCYLQPQQSRTNSWSPETQLLPPQQTRLNTQTAFFNVTHEKTEGVSWGSQPLSAHSAVWQRGGVMLK